MAMMAPFTSVCMLLLLFSFTTTSNAQLGLSTDFYGTRCPNFETVVKSIVGNVVSNEPRMGASLLRLHFHDCFVGGCDASVLLDVLGGEKESEHNVNSLRGFDIIDSIKQQVEVTCPGVVSCADILALSARDSVVALGGPSWSVEFGRTDSISRPSATAANDEIPFATDDLPKLISLFSSKGFSVKDLVALSGSHTIGQARCVRFRDRAYTESNIVPAFAQFLQNICPIDASGDNNLGPLDVRSPDAFNNEYFLGLTNFEGLLHTDQLLFTGSGAETDILVQMYASNEGVFFADFAAAILKMSRLGVQTGSSGAIRKNCRFLN